MIRALIIDDEPIACSVLEEMLHEYPEIELAGSYSDSVQAIQAIRDQKVDLLFLDIQMPELDGFMVLACLEAEQIPFVIFVTAFDHYAVRAFEVHALDYLMKPFDEDRFRIAVEHAKEMIARKQTLEFRDKLISFLKEQTESTREGGSKLSRIEVRDGNRIYFVDPDRMDWIEARDHELRIHEGSTVHIVRSSLEEINTRLDSGKFFRCHRSALVNLYRIREVDCERNSVILTNGTRVKLSRYRKSELLQLLKRIEHHCT